MTDDAGLRRFIEDALKENRRLKQEWINSLDPEEFSFGEVRHDPPWHILPGQWQGLFDVSRRSLRKNQALCGALLGRRLVNPPSGDADICGDCVCVAKALIDRANGTEQAA